MQCVAKKLMLKNYQNQGQKNEAFVLCPYFRNVS